MPRPSDTLQVGDQAPSFALPDSRGRIWQLEQALPLALFFFRGTY